ncbi:MAG: cysteine rich repeat-containing protein [Elusimicrobiota bacterium]
MDIRSSILLACVLAAGAVPARAETGACKADVEKFCQDVKPGRGRIIKCLKEHDKDLSEGCRNEGAKVQERFKEGAEKMMTACGADMEKFCKDVKPGEGRIIKCLRDHDKDLSEGCNALHHEAQEKFHAKMEERMTEIREACKADVEKSCKDVQPGDGRIVKCLHEHAQDLGEGCRAKMKGSREKRPEKSDKKD